MLWEIFLFGGIILFVMIPLFIFLLTGVIGAPYVPSDKKEIHKAFDELYKLSDKDLLVDMGCGDGIVVKIATEYGARAIGVELNPFMAWFCKIRLRKNKLAKIKSADMYRYKLPKDTTVVYMYMLPIGLDATFKHLKKEATRLNKTLYLISNAFDVSGIKPYKHEIPFYLYKIRPEENSAIPRRKLAK